MKEWQKMIGIIGYKIAYRVCNEPGQLDSSHSNQALTTFSLIKEKLEFFFSFVIIFISFDHFLIAILRTIC